MSKPSDLTARIKRIEAAQERAKVLKPSETISFEPMMELLRVSRGTLRDWCSELEGFEESGCFVRGGRGTEWEFNPRKTVAWLLDHFRAKAAAQSAKSRKITSAAGVDLPDSEETVSLAEAGKLLDLTLKATDARAKQGQYTLTTEVIDFIAGYDEELVSELMGIKTKVDPNGNLPPLARKALDQELRQLATRIHARATTYIEAKRAGIQQGGIG